MKWQVWIGYQIRWWRLSTPGGLMQKTVAARTGLTQDVVSRIESGERRVDAVELRALIAALLRDAAQLTGLFIPPTAAQWAVILSEYEENATYRDPPALRPLLRTQP